MGYMQELIQETIDKGLNNIKDVIKLRGELASKYKIKQMPSLIQIYANADKEQEKKLKFLVTKPVRTISGVAPVAIMTKPERCPHGVCSYCPGGPGSFFGDVPQSYTGNEPASMRAIRNNYDAYLQVMNRLEQYMLLGHFPDKVELIIMGGTFPAYKKDYQDKFIEDAFKAMNDFSDLFLKEGFDFERFKEIFELPSYVKNYERTRRINEKLLRLRRESTLEREQLRNESSGIRCIGLTIETKSDWGKLEEGNQMLRLGVTKVEVGVQSVYDKALKLTNRGHNIEDTKESLQILKDLGFKINAHYMLGLPEVNRKDDLEGLKQMFFDPDFKVDWMKIYPCLVMKGTPLYEQYKRGEYIPLRTEEAAEMIIETKKVVPKWMRFTRIQRDIPTKVTVDGVDRTNFRQYVHEKLEERGIVCNCIRCRESGRADKIEKVDILVEEYEAQKGKEFFISAEDVENNVLIGYCRLRFPYKFLRKEITKDSALLRELHIYSKLVPIGKKIKESMQHKGFGTLLMERAEEICKEYGKNKLVVISGIGTREYFKRKLGYYQDGPYVSKMLK